MYEYLISMIAENTNRALRMLDDLIHEITRSLAEYEKPEAHVLSDFSFSGTGAGGKATEQGERRELLEFRDRLQAQREMLQGLMLDVINGSDVEQIRSSGSAFFCTPDPLSEMCQKLLLYESEIGQSAFEITRFTSLCRNSNSMLLRSEEELGECTAAEMRKLAETVHHAYRTFSEMQQAMQCADAGFDGGGVSGESRGEIKPRDAAHPEETGPDVSDRAQPKNKVEFTAVAPKEFVKGDYTLIHVLMYEEAYRGVVDEVIAGMDVPAQKANSGIQRVAEGSSVRVVLTSPDIGIRDGEETRTWEGGYLDFGFAVLLPEDYARRLVLFNALVYVNGVRLTRLTFTAECVSDARQKITVTRADVLSAFVSYASQDREEVASIIRGMQIARPELDVFFDVESLRCGEKWEQALYREIDRRDVLYLCWSRNARDSKWVDAEWHYALARKGDDCIEPVAIEGPDVCPPPRELNHKHFSDKMLYIIAYAKNAKNAKDAENAGKAAKDLPGSGETDA